MPVKEPALTMLPPDVRFGVAEALVAVLVLAPASEDALAVNEAVEVVVLSKPFGVGVDASLPEAVDVTFSVAFPSGPV